MNDAIQPQPGILDIALYQGGKGHVAGIANAVKLSSNENPFGVSDRARDVFLRSAHSLNRYPSTDHAALRAAIADVHGLDADRVICGAGSGEVLMSLCQAYAGPKDEVVYTEHSFLMYPIYTKSVGATAVEVAERERTVDVDAVLSACNRRTKLVFIANPANPTGTMISAAEVEHLAAKMPPQALLVLDGAYAEYVEGYDAGLGIIEARENVVMTRTFSKIYGLGGLRIGWGYGPKHVIDVLNRIRGPFNLSTTQQDVAEAAVQDRDWVNRCRSENARQRTWLASALAELGVPSDTSMANFILARFSSPDEAQACDAFLQSKGLIVRSVAGYKLPHCLRITIGDESSCRRVAHAVAQFKGAK